MSIRPSLSSDITRLMAELVSGDAHRRELAVARLSVIGSRATSALLTVADDPANDTDTRVAAIEALAAIGDSRVAATAHALATGPADDRLAAAAIELLGPIAKGNDARATRVFDQLAALVTSAEVSASRRLAALTALDGQPARLLKPLYEALAKDPSARVVARATRHQAGALESLDTLATRPLPDDPELVLAVVRDDGERATLPTLKKIVDATRAREQRERAPQDRARWSAVRGAVHQQLASRNSRLALYDLRETLEAAAGPLHVGFLSAAAAIGDTACLTPLAHAWVTASDDDRWWREHLADAFRAIVKREGLTRRHTTLRKILERWPAAGVLVAVAKK